MTVLIQEIVDLMVRHAKRRKDSIAGSYTIRVLPLGYND